MGRIGEIFAAHGDAYRARFAERMSLDQLRAMHAIEVCHTAAAGTARWRCPRCDARHFTFVGCGNRHCPQCGASRAAQWLQKHSALLLPRCTYHLVTFTVPEQLRRPIRSHPRELLDCLIKQAASTLMALAADPRWLGALPGATAVLHTWTRQLEYHPHVHFIVTGGGIDPTGRWRDGDPRFLVHVEALSKVFRARMRDDIRKHHADLFRTIDPRVWTQSWVVHSKPVGAGEKALVYLSRYVQRVALSDRAILQHDEKQVVIRYRESNTNVPRTLRLNPHEFLRRFLQHVLPSGFRKVRYFGLHHSSRRPLLRLLQAMMRILYGIPAPPSRVDALHEHVPACPRCDAPMQFEKRMPSTPVAYAHPLTRLQPRAPP